MKKINLFILTLTFFQTAFGQESSDKSNNFLVNAIANKLNAQEVILGEYLGNTAALAKMNSSKKWGIYYYDDYRISEDNIEDIQSQTFKEIVPPKYDSLNFMREDDNFQIVKKNNKYGILRNPNIYNGGNSIKSVNCKYEKLIHKRIDDTDLILFKFDGKWGLMNWAEELVFIDPIFTNPNDVPLVMYSPWELKSLSKLKRKLRTDLVIFAPYGDGVFKARKRKTQKWGMFQLLRSDLVELIPPKYDSLPDFPSNDEFIEVHNNGKVGFYLSYWKYEKKAKQTVECKYEDYKTYKTNNVMVLAVKKGGKWGWVDWLTGEEKSEFIFDTFKELPSPNYKQHTDFEELVDELDEEVN